MLSNMNGELNGTTEEPMETSPIKEEDADTEMKETVSEKGLTNNTNINNRIDNVDNIKRSPINSELNNGLDHTDMETEMSSEDVKLVNGKQFCNSNDIDIKIPGDQNFEEKPNNSDTETIIPKDNIEEIHRKTNNKDIDIKLTLSDDKENENDIIHLADVSKDVSDHDSHIADTVSIHSDSDDLQNSGEHNKSNDVIILENESPKSSHVHEIESENDCIVTNETNKLNSKEKAKDEPQTRRSPRSNKRVKYDVDNENETESDVELIMEKNVKRKSKSTVVNDKQKPADITVKQGSQNKEPTMVVTDTLKTTSKSSNSYNSLYQSFVGRGTTVTPVKINSCTQASQPGSSPIQSTLPQTEPNILPSLTDDMFVVETPSFIVPYVYEAPPLTPFREFVDKLGKQLEDRKERQEREMLDKKKQEKVKREQEKKEKSEKEEKVENSDDDTDKVSASQVNLGCDIDSQETKKKKAKKERQRKNEDDDASWDGSESDISDDDETITDEESAIEVLKEKSDNIETAIDLSLTASSGKSESFFDGPLGNFFTNIGINLVKEYVQTDLIKQQNRKLYREKKTGHSTKEREITIAALMKNLELSKETNVPFKHPLKKCKLCSFKTESELVMQNHLQTPHMKNNLYRCNFCSYEIKNPRDILFHMEAEHNIKGKLERAASYHQCPNCPFEDNGKGKLARHQIACAKKYKPEQNLTPPFEWEPPAKIPKLVKGRNSLTGPYLNNFGRPSFDKSMQNVGGDLGIYSSLGRPRGKALPSLQPRGLPISGAHIVRSGIPYRQPTSAVGNIGKGKSLQHASISITPLPRQPMPMPIHTLPLPPPNVKNSSFVICEICDGYIKDLEQLRNHMQWIHKVKIHPKMIYNRPPLNCQKCQFRFFTDQGLERHLLGSHGLVTNSMQEAANKGKDAGRCPVCGRVYQWKLLSHVARDHSVTLKPAHLSYKCTVCTATFGMYKQFESHVYSAHSVVAKRVIDKNKPTATPAKTADTAAKTLKIDDQITVAPHPPPAAPSQSK